ncbi:MAG: hypothetical protein [Microviridae sp.]|nr:MAG: hypothetical protein [Microviridae sp.]
MGLFENILSGVGMFDSLARNGTVSREGTQLNYSPSWYEKIFGVNSDKQLSIQQQNIANDQFERQFGLQKEGQAANIQNMQFNQQLASRQQDMAEESYKNGIINQANQWQKLGVNPSALSGSVSGQSMSGGSSVPGVSPSSASGRNGSTFSMESLASVLPSILAYRSAKQQNDIEEKRVDTESRLADSTINDRDRRFGLDEAVGSATIKNYDASSRLINSQASYQELINTDFNKFLSMLPEHLPYSMINAFKGLDWRIAAALGVSTAILDFGQLFNKLSSSFGSFKDLFGAIGNLKKSVSPNVVTSSSARYSGTSSKSSSSKSSDSKSSGSRTHDAKYLVDRNIPVINDSTSKKSAYVDNYSGPKFDRSQPLKAFKPSKSVPQISIVEELVGSENLLNDEDFEAYKELNFEALNVVHNVQIYESLPNDIKKDVKEVVEEHPGIDITIDTAKLEKLNAMTDYLKDKSSKIQKAYVEDVIIQDEVEYEEGPNGFVHRKGFAGSTQSSKMVKF